MKRSKVLLVVLATLSLSGCTVYEGLFSVFGDSYSGGGTTRAEREADYEAQIERWNHASVENR